MKPSKPEYLAAFYFGLRDTLVVDSLEAATRIAYGGPTRHKVVTLRGDVIDVTGTMSGGGGKRRDREGVVLERRSCRWPCLGPRNGGRFALTAWLVAVAFASMAWMA